MQTLHPNVLVANHARWVQSAPKIHWLSPEQAEGMVEMLPQASGVSAWVEWVDRVGGAWASEADLAQL